MNPQSQEPVSKQAAIFISRKTRVETIAHALEIFSGKICSPEVAENIKELISNCKKGEDSILEVSVKVKRDLRAQDAFAVTMISKITTVIGNETFYGLK